MMNDEYARIEMSVNRELAEKLDRIAASRSVGVGAVCITALREHVAAYELFTCPVASRRPSQPCARARL